MRLILLVLIAFAFSAAGIEPAKANNRGDGVIGWVSPSGPGGTFDTAEDACRAQWNKFMNDGYDRFIGATQRKSDWTYADCQWTRYQYLCPQETSAGFACGTIIPSYVRFECEAGYTPVFGGFCREDPPLECACDEAGRETPTAGNPIVLRTGAKLARATDYESPDGDFQISRSYRSFQIGMPLDGKKLPFRPMRGLAGGWNFDFLYELQLGTFSGSPSSPNATVALLNPDGTGIAFVLQPDGSWIPDPALGAANAKHRLKLEYVGTLPQDLADIKTAPSDWKLTHRDDTIITLRTRVGPNGQTYDRAWPVETKRRDGYQWDFVYGADSSLASITDSFGRVASFSWNDFYITTLSSPPSGSLPYPEAIVSIDLPDGTSLKYSYDPEPAQSAPSSAAIERLVKVERQNQSGQVLDSVEYLYEDARFRTHLTGVIDNEGKRARTYAYDAKGRATLSQGLGGSNSYSVEYLQSGNDRISRVTNPLGKVKEYTFTKFTGDGAGDYRLTQIVGEASANTASSTASVSYGGDTFSGTRTDEEGRSIVSARDAEGRATTIVEASATPSERTSTITWHPTLNVPVTIVREGLTESRTYDAAGRLQSMTQTDTTTHTVPYSTNGQSRTHTYQWDANGRLLSVDGPLPVGPNGENDITSFAYDAQGNLTSVTDALGHATTFSNFGPDGRAETITDPNGAVTTLEHDDLGRVTKVTAKHPSNSALDAVTTVTYDLVGRVASVDLPATEPVLFDYDAAGRVARMRAATGESWEYAYDAMGNVTQETVVRSDSSTFRTIRRGFDELSRLSQLREGARSPAKWGYDKVGNIVSSTSANGHETTATVDALDRVVSTVAPDSGVSAYTYDEQDNALTFTDPISVTTQFVYNGFGEVIQEVSPDRGTNTYVYDGAGRLTQSTDGRGQVIDLTHDYLGRVTSKVPQGRPASETITYHYDSGGLAGSYEVGRLAKVVDGSGTTLFKYDHRGNLTAKQQSIGTSGAAQLAYEYDLHDRVTQITYPSGRLVRYGYDSKGRINLVETKSSAAAPTWETVASNHSYEPFGPIKAMDLGNGLAVANEWSSDGRLASRRLYRQSNGSDLSNLSYRRDADGNIGSITDHVNPANTVLYGYDEVGRLVLTAANSSGSMSENYSYASGTNRLDTFTDASGTRTIGYDGRGNTLSEARPGSIAVTASYDGYGRLISYDRTNMGQQDYTYNGLDDRVKVVKPTATRHFIYDSAGRVMAEYGASASEVKAEFIWASPTVADGTSVYGGADVVGGYAPLAVATPDSFGTVQLYWVHGNHLGVPLVTTDNLASEVTPPNDYLLPGFPGQSRVVSDLYYNRYRDYDPVTGRYFQADPIGLNGGSNSYVYAEGDPVNGIDPIGLQMRKVVPRPGIRPIPGFPTPGDRNGDGFNDADQAAASQLNRWLCENSILWRSAFCSTPHYPDSRDDAKDTTEEGCPPENDDACWLEREQEERYCKRKFGAHIRQYGRCMDRASINFDLCKRGMEGMPWWTDEMEDGVKLPKPPKMPKRRS